MGHLSVSVRLIPLMLLKFSSSCFGLTIFLMTLILSSSVFNALRRLSIFPYFTPTKALCVIDTIQVKFSLYRKQSFLQLLSTTFIFVMFIRRSHITPMLFLPLIIFMRESLFIIDRPTTMFWSTHSQ